MARGKLEEESYSQKWRGVIEIEQCWLFGVLWCTVQFMKACALCASSIDLFIDSVAWAEILST